MQRTTESTIIKYAKVTFTPDGTMNGTIATHKIPEKDPEKAVKKFRSFNDKDSIIATEPCSDTGYLDDYIWYLFESKDKESARRLAKAVKLCENEILEIIHAKLMELVTEENTTEVEG